MTFKIIIWNGQEQVWARQVEFDTEAEAEAYSYGVFHVLGKDVTEREVINLSEVAPI